LESPGDINTCHCLANAAVSGCIRRDFQYWKSAPGLAVVQPLLFLPVELVALWINVYWRQRYFNQTE